MSHIKNLFFVLFYGRWKLNEDSSKSDTKNRRNSDSQLRISNTWRTVGECAQVKHRGVGWDPDAILVTKELMQIHLIICEDKLNRNVVNFTLG